MEETGSMDNRIVCEPVTAGFCYDVNLILHHNGMKGVNGLKLLSHI